MRILLVFLLTAVLAPAQIARFTVRETAGLRRFSFPVRVSIKAAAIPLQLLDSGKPVPAQFTPMGDGMTDVDFNASLGPLESREYRVDRASAASPAAKGVTVEQADHVITVRHGLQFEVPDDLRGFLNQAGTDQLRYLRSGSQGLMLNDRPLPGGKAKITKRGPLVGAIRFESGRSVVEMDFPRSKSWVEVRWTADDPQVSSMAVDLNLLIEGSPTLVDFGASDTVYAALKPGQRFALSAGPPSTWFVHLDDEPYATGKDRAEGWAHVMDKQRATAIAVADFDGLSRDRIEISADGHTRIRRDFTGAGQRSRHFWIHFVPMPVQLGAATSPQAMQSPLAVQLQP
jgi:hypothetical protein